MMSQNLQSAKDRLDAEIDHSENVRAELAIRQLSKCLHMIKQMFAVTAFEGPEQQANYSDQTKTDSV